MTSNFMQTTPKEHVSRETIATQPKIPNGSVERLWNLFLVAAAGASLRRHIFLAGIEILLATRGEEPRGNCRASSIPKEEEVYSRLLTPQHHDYDCIQHYRSRRDSEPSGTAITTGCTPQ
jgi:hypothetical protein